jgi:hypothetical protein
VARELEDRKIPTPGEVLAARGQLHNRRTYSSLWRLSTLGRILSNPAYIGKHSGWRVVREKVIKRDPISGEIHTVVRQIELAEDNPERVTLPASTCPPLVDEASFDAVQQILERNRQNASRRMLGPEATLLRGGFAICGWCGRNMQPHLDRGKYYRYYCGSICDIKANHCPHGRWSVLASQLDRIVWNWVLRAFQKPQTIRAVFERWKAVQAEGRTIDDGRLDAVKEALSVATNKWRNCLTSAAEAKDEETWAQFTHMAEEAGKQMKQLQKDYDKLPTIFRRTDARVAQVDSLIAMGQFALENLRTASYQDKRTFLYALGVVIKVKSSTDFKIDWRLENIQEE